MTPINKSDINFHSGYSSNKNGWYVDDEGSKYCFVNDFLNSINDKPAIIWYNGEKRWFKNGYLHRDNDKPSVVMPDKVKYWHKNGMIHREHGPALIVPQEKKKYWYFQDFLTNINGYAQIINNNKSCFIFNKHFSLSTIKGLPKKNRKTHSLEQIYCEENGKEVCFYALDGIISDSESVSVVKKNVFTKCLNQETKRKQFKL